MITNVKTCINHTWNFVFDQIECSIRHIPDVYFRHYVVQVSGLMWAVSFSVTIGRYLLMAASILGKSSLKATAIVSMATFAVAVQRPKLFMRCAGRRSDGKADFSLIFSGHKLKVKIVNAGPLEKKGARNCNFTHCRTIRNPAEKFNCCT